jgi:hypothetical protein
MQNVKYLFQPEEIYYMVVEEGMSCEGENVD